MGAEPQMLLTKQIVKDIVSYGDLYNACLIEFGLVHPDNTEVFKQGLEKLAGLMDHYGFVRELEDTMRGGIIHVDTDGLSEHRSQFLDVLVEILFDQAKLNSSNSESWSFPMCHNG